MSDLLQFKIEDHSLNLYGNCMKENCINKKGKKVKEAEMQNI
jgi:hypothetical protein